MRTILSAGILLYMLGGCGTVLTNRTVPVEAPGAFHKPAVEKVVLVVLENKNPRDIEAFLHRKDGDYPFLRMLANSGAYFSNYHAVAHPSQPNYIALVSGSTQGVAGDRRSRINRPHLGQLIPFWKVYAEDYPPDNCDLSSQIGKYARRHVPFLSFADVQDDHAYCLAHVTHFLDFPAAAASHTLPDFSLVIPNLDNDGHDKSLRDADAWLETHFSALIQDPAFKRQTLFIVTFDENDDPWPYIFSRQNRVTTILWGDAVQPGEVNAPYDHYELLRTIEAIFSVDPMAEGDRNARPITGIWREIRTER